MRRGTSENKPNKATELLPEPTIRRLPWYLAYVSMLRSENIEYVSSTRISEELHVDSSQIAKDLSFINIKGKTRIGYEVASLEEALRSFLGFSQRHDAVMVGAGSLGAALMQDSGLQRYGLNIVAGIDTNPGLIGTEIAGIPVYGPEQLAPMVKQLHITVGIIAVPVESAQTVADALIAAGVRALWNFTPTRIRVDNDDVVVTNTSIYSHLAVMYNRLSNLPDPASR